MRRLLVAFAFLVAIIGLVVAFALPNGTIHTCPDPRLGFPGAKCIDTPDPRAPTRFAIAAATGLPAIVLLAVHFGARRGFRLGFVAVGIGVAVVLWWVSGLVPAEGGDCPPYQRCFTMGHPYGGPAALVVLMTFIGGLWLKLAYSDVLTR